MIVYVPVVPCFLYLYSNMIVYVPVVPCFLYLYSNMIVYVPVVPCFLYPFVEVPPFVKQCRPMASLVEMVH
jgi:hypothetical protein